MEGGIDADAPVDYAEFQIFPSQNSYNAFVCNDNKVEAVASGLLERLLPHFAKVKDLCSKGANFKFKLCPPDNVTGAKWFTKSTLTRFLCIVGSSDKLTITNTIVDEISQLEETIKFHLSLHAKAEVDIAPSDASKNELLRAMDLRLAALGKELAASLNQAAGVTCSLKEITDIAKLSDHFGALDLRNLLQKFVELNQKRQIVDFPSDNKYLLANDSRNEKVNNTEGSSQISIASHTETPVKYGISPAKVAQVERQSSSESEESSYSSEEDKKSVERSRTLTRSAAPRRSASPIRRIQIGRSGSHRATALTIKSLNFFPPREKAVSHRDAATNSSEEEEFEQPLKKPDYNVRRMSVQAAISLFERKQQDQTGDIQKTRSLLNASVGANKSVLRRWSAGMGESSAQCIPDSISESSVQMTPNKLAVGEIPKSSQEVKPEPDVISGGYSSVETAGVDVKLELSEERACSPIIMQPDTLVTQTEESSKKLTASAEWSRQKEAELNQLLMTMMESKPVRYQNVGPDSGKSQHVPSKAKGGFYDHYKEKRTEKLRGEAAGKRAEKEAQFKALQHILDERKAEMASATASNVARRQTVSKPQRSRKSLPQSPNPKTETSKPAAVKKASAKQSPLPATRKSWPSTPSARATGVSIVKMPTGMISAGNTPTRWKPEPTSSVPRSSPKVERSQPRPKTVKATQNNTHKSIKGVKEKKQQTVIENKQRTGAENQKTTKAKIQTTYGDNSSMMKPSFYGKVTKKSSVVPLESKPFLRKGSRIGPSVGPVVKTKFPSQHEESQRNSGDLIQAEESEVSETNISDLVTQQQERTIEAREIHADLESETTQLNIPRKGEDTERTTLVTASGDDGFSRMEESAFKTEDEQVSIISPAAWEEIEELDDQPIPCNDRSSPFTSSANVAPVGMSNSRVRHSLSQMMLKESSEPDIIEWGIAENPPAMIFQKDVPKGLKRLLKFARKSRPDANLTGWSSQSVFSEGEDEAEESGAVTKKNADNIRMKAAFPANNYGQPKASSCEAYEKNSAAQELSAQSRKSKLSAQSSHKLHDGHVSTSAATTKATRSFFSLSAFRGTKLNETKHP